MNLLFDRLSRTDCVCFQLQRPERSRLPGRLNLPRRTGSTSTGKLPRLAPSPDARKSERIRTGRGRRGRRGGGKTGKSSSTGRPSFQRLVRSSHSCQTQPFYFAQVKHKTPCTRFAYNLLPFAPSFLTPRFTIVFTCTAGEVVWKGKCEVACPCKRNFPPVYKSLFPRHLGPWCSF